MNLFRTYDDPVRAAQALADQHVVKMSTEAVQVLCTALHGAGASVPWRPTHAHHPCVVWVGRSREAAEWAAEHADALCAEYAFRYGRAHAARDVLRRIRPLLDALPARAAQAPPACVLPESAHLPLLEAYRHTLHIKYGQWALAGRPARYTRRGPPTWAGDVCVLDRAAGWDDGSPGE